MQQGASKDGGFSRALCLVDGRGIKSTRAKKRNALFQCLRAFHRNCFALLCFVLYQFILLLNLLHLGAHETPASSCGPFKKTMTSRNPQTVSLNPSPSPF
jgi:hypothetical protein